MARRCSKGLLLLMALAVTVQISAAQTRYQVGDALGWTIPPSGASAYTTWASGKTFSVGDTLVFNFTNGRHDVAEVTKAAFDTCNGTSPLSNTASSPVSIVLNRTGDHHYICTFSGHCDAGQKLQVRVSTASSSPSPSPAPAPGPQSSSSAPTPTRAPSTSPARAPAPSPQPRSSAPTPTPAVSTSPAPAPAAGSVTYTVGDTRGWGIPSANGANYQSWPNGKSFKVGDVLVFNFVSGTHNVAELTKQAYNSCNISRTVSLATNAPVRINLTTPGQHYYTCTVPGHCSAGQKLAINVTGAAKSPSPSEAPAPSPSGSATPPSGGATTPSASATPPSTSSGPSGESPAAGGAPPPPGNSAASLGLASPFATFIAITVAFLVY